MRTSGYGSQQKHIINSQQFYSKHAIKYPMNPLQVSRRTSKEHTVLGVTNTSPKDLHNEHNYFLSLLGFMQFSKNEEHMYLKVGRSSMNSHTVISEQARRS